MRRGKPLTEKNRLPPKILQALEETNLEWSVESSANGWKIKLAGRMVASLSASRHAGGDFLKNVVAAVRRRAREVSSDQSQ